MTVSDSFKTYVLEQFGRLRPDIRARAMFGGIGVYAGELFFALIDDDVVYLKVDDETRGAFEAAGTGPFMPFGPGGEVMQYYELPEGLLDEPEDLRSWVDAAIEVATRAKGRKKKASGPGPRATGRKKRE
ncbi:MAG TPA: TfoX/Sxy family protein [Gemmatimonadales bacterium]|nr:TfoX/Sxy family protein [Gemmatimonadales bacterium]